MKILAINGSPRGEHGSTSYVLQLFAEGIKEAGGDVHIAHLAKHKIHHCTGELACWLKTPGKCIHRDDMDQLLPLFNEAEGIIFATPVYVDGMTGLMKNFIDRLVPSVQPFFELRDGHMRHPRISKIRQKVVLLSVCGFIEMDNFDPLISHIKAMCKNMDADLAGMVLRPSAPGLNVAKFLHPIKTHKIRSAIKEAGKEFAVTGQIKTETSQMISQQLFTTDQYVDGGNKEFHKVLDKLGQKKE